MTDATAETSGLVHTSLPKPIDAMTDRELLERVYLLLDHADPMLHRADQLAQKLEPLLERWGSFLGSPVRDYRAARRAAKKGGSDGG